MKSSVQKTYFLEERQRLKEETTDYVSILSFFSGFLAGKCLFSARLEHSRSNFVFDVPDDFIFGMLY